MVEQRREGTPNSQLLQSDPDEVILGVQSHSVGSYDLIKEITDAIGVLLRPRLLELIAP
jgi:hypothetical protein